MSHPHPHPRQTRNFTRTRLTGYSLIAFGTDARGLVVFGAIIIRAVVEGTVALPHGPPTPLVLKMPIETDKWSVLITLVLQERRALLHAKLLQVAEGARILNLISCSDSGLRMLFTCNGWVFPAAMTAEACSSRPCFVNFFENNLLPFGRVRWPPRYPRFRILMPWQMYEQKISA